MLLFSLVTFTYWSKFFVNIITGSGVTTIFVYKGLITNPKIGNKWRKLGIPNLVQISVINVTECCRMPGLQLLPFRVIKGKIGGEGVVGGKIASNPG